MRKLDCWWCGKRCDGSSSTVRDGRLLCIGPVRTSATLGDRLLQDKIISQQVWQEVKSILGSDEQSETRVAIALMERGYVTREQLRAWATEKSLTVLGAILAWTSGEIYFEESTQPPSDRLLVSMSITSLIDNCQCEASFSTNSADTDNSCTFWYYEVQYYSEVPLFGTPHFHLHRLLPLQSLPLLH